MILIIKIKDAIDLPAFWVVETGRFHEMFVLRRNVQLAAYYEQTGDLVRRHDCLLEIFRIVKSLGEDHPSPQVHGLLATLTRELYRACRLITERLQSLQAPRSVI